MIALAALSQDQLLNMLRSAALLSPIAYVGQLTSPLAKNAAENFIAEVFSYKHAFIFGQRKKEKKISVFKIQKIVTKNLFFFTSLQSLYNLGIFEFNMRG